jgi:hypothetical protein
MTETEYRGMGDDPLAGKMRIWFHGTDAVGAGKISAEGFKPGTYFSENLEDAIEFGGTLVFEVALDYQPRLANAWQMSIGEKVPATAIVGLKQYTVAVREDYPDRRKAVFDATIASERVCDQPAPPEEKAVARSVHYFEAIKLVERLRAHMGKAGIEDVLADCRKAADEIERWRDEASKKDAELTVLRNQLGKARAFLKKLVAHSDNYGPRDEICQRHYDEAVKLIALSDDPGTK